MIFFVQPNSQLVYQTSGSSFLKGLGRMKLVEYEGIMPDSKIIENLSHQTVVRILFNQFRCGFFHQASHRCWPSLSCCGHHYLQNSGSLPPLKTTVCPWKLMVGRWNFRFKCGENPGLRLWWNSQEKVWPSGTQWGSWSPATGKRKKKKNWIGLKSHMIRTYTYTYTYIYMHIIYVSIYIICILYLFINILYIFQWYIHVMFLVPPQTLGINTYLVRSCPKSMVNIQPMTFKRSLSMIQDSGGGFFPPIWKICASQIGSFPTK